MLLECSQIRAARALLNWSQADLARAARMANSSIKNIESENASARRESYDQVRAALESNGVEFLPGSGVKLKTEIVSIFNGRDATPALFDSLYAAAHASPDREILVMGLDEEFALRYDGQANVEAHYARLARAGIRQKILACEGSTRFIAGEACYRLLPRESFGPSAPVYVYGDRIATHTGNLRRQTIIIENRPLARTQRAMFASLWHTARVPLNVEVAAATIGAGER